MNGYSSHTYKWVNDNNEQFYVKYTFKTDQGNKTLCAKKAAELGGTQKDYATVDLFNSIQ